MVQYIYRFKDKIMDVSDKLYKGPILKDFIITIDTREGLNDTDFTLGLDTFYYTYNFNIDWGDGVKERIINPEQDITHTYSSPGIYQIKIGGEFPNTHFSAANDDNSYKKVISIDQWGDIFWGSMNEAFRECENMTGNYTDAPNLDYVTSASQMFQRCYLFNGPIDNFDTSNITDMSYMFAICDSFNQPLDNFDTSNVTDMSYMFAICDSFNQPLDNFNTSNVIDMSWMFNGCRSFNQLLDNFDTSNVTNMSGMFDGAVNFNQPLNNFNTSNVTDMSRMFGAGFDNCYFNQPLDNFNTSNVTNMSEMFSWCINFNQPLDNFDTSNVTNMSLMFYGCRSFNQPLNNFNTSNVTNMSGMFRNCENFNEPFNLDTSNVTDMSQMFSRIGWMTQDIILNIISEPDMTEMFEDSELERSKYDNLLISFKDQAVNNNITGLTFSGGNSRYTNTGEAARDILINDYNWTITDAGLIT